MSLIEKITGLMIPSKLLGWIMSDRPAVPPRAEPQAAPRAEPARPAPPAPPPRPAPSPKPAPASRTPSWWPTQPDPSPLKTAAEIAADKAKDYESSKIIPIPAHEARRDELEDDHLISLFRSYIDNEGPAAAPSEAELQDELLPRLIAGFLDWLPNKHVGYHSSYKTVLVHWLRDSDFLRGELLDDGGRGDAWEPPGSADTGFGMGSRGDDYPASQDELDQWLRGTG